MHTLRLRLITTTADVQELDTRFRLIWHMHNECVSFAQHRLNELYRDRQYKDAIREYAACAKEVKGITSHGRKQNNKLTTDQKLRVKTITARKKELSNVMNARVSALRLRKGDLYKFVAIMQHQHKARISSQQAQREAERVLAGVEKVLYSNGKHVRMKRLADQHSLSQKCATNGVKVSADMQHIEWNGLTLGISINWNDPYIKESLHHKLRYAEIVRLAFDNGWHYYVNLVLEGSAPKKLFPGDAPTTGIDPGMSTIAAVSDNGVSLFELAPAAASYNRKIAKQQRLIDTSTRLSNPDNYNPDGTAKKGRHSWTITKGCSRRKQKLRVLQRKQAAAIRLSHNIQANALITKHGANILAESMDYAALKRRSKAKATRQTTTSIVKRPDGTRLTIHKFKRKRRFGTSVQGRAPASFLTILANKAALYGGGYAEIDTRSFRASQYHHDTGEYIKTQLSDRWKQISGHAVQRDLYSAFLIRCSDPAGKAADRDLCTSLFESFVVNHDEFINNTKCQNHPACFGY